jgi:hypothetical protein
VFSPRRFKFELGELFRPILVGPHPFVKQRSPIFSLISAVLLLATSCKAPPPKPTADEAIRAVKEYYTTQGTTAADVRVVRFGESGKADFSTPGSQDIYWAVEFDSPSRQVAKLGPLEINSKDVHGIAHIYRTKMGTWKVAQIER